jgi:hypothetical protein
MLAAGASMAAAAKHPDIIYKITMMAGGVRRKRKTAINITYSGGS